MSGEPVPGGKADPVTMTNLATSGIDGVLGIRILALIVSITRIIFAGTVVITSPDREAFGFKLPLVRILTIFFCVALIFCDNVDFLEAFILMSFLNGMGDVA